MIVIAVTLLNLNMTAKLKATFVIKINILVSNYTIQYQILNSCRIRRLRCVSSHKQITGIDELLVSARQILSQAMKELR